MLSKDATLHEAQTNAPSLLGVIERFNESTAKLEARHVELISEVERLQDQLRHKDEEIKKSERLATLGETAAGLAHEIRNPLGAISLFVSMLRRDLQDRAETLELLDQVELGIRSLDGVVSNVLHFAQNKRPNVAPINVHSVCQELYQHFSTSYSPQSTFDLKLSGNPFIKADEQGIRQCLYNVILNALQAVSFAGKISIDVADDNKSDGIIITISDDGPGIPAHLMSDLFEPFTSGRREGTGLGLSIVRRIVESHGGEVSVVNKPSAEFSIYLPRQGETK